MRTTYDLALADELESIIKLRKDLNDELDSFNRNMERLLGEDTRSMYRNPCCIVDEFIVNWLVSHLKESREGAEWFLYEALPRLDVRPTKVTFLWKEYPISNVLDYVRMCIDTNFNNNGRYTFIDLFAGIGGMHIAYESAGARCVYANEWDKYCQQTYFANFGIHPEGDITKVPAEDIPEHDILVAGFPCQPFSIAGVSKNKSMGRNSGFDDKTRGTLFFDVCRILKAKRPKAFMLENVKNLCSHDKGRTFKVIQESLAELNYKVFFRIIDGKEYVPQHRERIVIVGFDMERYGSGVDFEFALSPCEKQPVMKDILEATVADKYTLSDKLWAYLQKYAAKHRAAGNGFGYGIASPDGVSRTLSARYYKDGSEILIEQEGKNPRRLTPRECARLQGFPDMFEIPVSDMQAYKQFGNSVVVPLMSDVAKLVVKKLGELDDAVDASRDVRPANN